MNSYGYSPLHFSILYKQFSALKVLHEAGADIHQTVTRTSSRNALDLAISSEDPDENIICYLTGHYVKFGVTNFENSVRDGNYGALVFLTQNPNFNCVNQKAALKGSPSYFKKSSIYYAIQGAIEYPDSNFYSKVIKDLLARKVDINEIFEKNFSKNDEKTCLNLAINYSRKDIVELLLKSGAFVNIDDLSFESPLQKACKKDNIDIIQMLLHFKADPNVKNNFSLPLHISIKNNSIHVEQIIFLLLKFGANLNILDSSNSSPLFTACTVENFSLVKMLLENGANPNHSLNNQFLPLHFFINENLLSDFNKISLCNSKLSSYIRIIPNSTRSTKSNIEKDLSILSLLLDYKADPNLLDNHLRHPLYLAYINNKFDIFKFLLKRGANPNFKIQGDKPFINLIIEENKEDLFNLLVDHIDINDTDNKLKTPLHLACKSKNIKIINKLLDLKANANLQDCNGETPLFLLTRKNQNRAYNLNFYNRKESKKNQNLKEKNIKVNDSILTAEDTVKNIEEFINLEKTFLRLLKNTININLKNNDSLALIHYACQREKFIYVNYLLEQKADVNILDEESNTPLHWTLDSELKTDHNFYNSQKYNKKNSHKSPIVSLLLTYGALNQPNIQNVTPLQLACREKFFDIIDLLLDKRSKVNIKNKYHDTLLHLIIVDKHYRRKTDDSYKSYYNYYEYKDEYHRYNNEYDTNDEDEDEDEYDTDDHNISVRIEKFLKLGVNVNDINIEGDSALHLACEKGYSTTIDLLLKFGADVNLKNISLKTPVHLLAEGFYIQDMINLINKGAEVNVKDENGFTPLHYILKNKQYNENRIKKIFPLLLEKKVDVNILDDEQTSPLHLALINNYPNIAIELIANSADINIPFGKHKVPTLELALKNNHLEVALLLIKQGVPVHLSQMYKNTPLYLAILDKSNHPIVKHLLEYGACIDSFDQNSDNPFYVAWTKRYGKIVELLLNYGADPNISFVKDSKSISPLEEAINAKNLKAVRCLLKHGAEVKPSMLHDIIRDIQTRPWRRPQEFTNNNQTLLEKSNDLQIIDLLLKYGADPNYINIRGQSLIELALDKNKAEAQIIIKKLYEAGAYLHILNSKKIPLIHQLIEKNFLEYLGSSFNSIPSLKWLALKVTVRTFSGSPQQYESFIEALKIQAPLLGEKYFQEYFQNDEDYLAIWLNQIGQKEKETRKLEKLERERRERSYNYSEDSDGYDFRDRYDVEGLITSDDFIEYNRRW